MELDKIGFNSCFITNNKLKYSYIMANKYNPVELEAVNKGLFRELDLHSFTHPVGDTPAQLFVGSYNPLKNT